MDKGKYFYLKIFLIRVPILLIFQRLHRIFPRRHVHLHHQRKHSEQANKRQYRNKYPQAYIDVILIRLQPAVHVPTLYVSRESSGQLSLNFTRFEYFASQEIFCGILR